MRNIVSCPYIYYALYIILIFNILIMENCKCNEEILFRYFTRSAEKSGEERIIIDVPCCMNLFVLWKTIILNDLYSARNGKEYDAHNSTEEQDYFRSNNFLSYVEHFTHNFRSSSQSTYFVFRCLENWNRYAIRVNTLDVK